jgi:hypothetical protein
MLFNAFWYRKPINSNLDLSFSAVYPRGQFVRFYRLEYKQVLKFLYANNLFDKFEPKLLPITKQMGPFLSIFDIKNEASDYLPTPEDLYNE